mmetsp:Transcript_100104/g.283404  ORF Transcript_100104/g.283404 Transcript_100104/m.283404 type:complete len:208 (+) Transcript_100104:156-779(+)
MSRRAASGVNSRFIRASSPWCIFDGFRVALNGFCALLKKRVRFAASRTHQASGASDVRPMRPTTVYSFTRVRSSQCADCSFQWSSTLLGSWRSIQSTASLNGIAWYWYAFVRGKQAFPLQSPPHLSTKAEAKRANGSRTKTALVAPGSVKTFVIPSVPQRSVATQDEKPCQERSQSGNVDLTICIIAWFHEVHAFFSIMQIANRSSG